MKSIYKTIETRSTNCGGSNQKFTIEQFEIIPEDVGHLKNNYLGYKHKTYKFKLLDIGRIIEVMSQKSGYNCFYFVINRKG